MKHLLADFSFTLKIQKAGEKMLLPLFLFVGCGPKKNSSEIPSGDWYQAENWSVSCYNPPKYEAETQLKRQENREAALDALLLQWKQGGRPDGLSLEETMVTEVEDVILGDMTKVEKVSRENFFKCKQVANGKLSKGEWKEWVIKLPFTLTEGECNTPFVNKVLDPDLSIDIDWEPQDGYPICEGNKIKISGTTEDQFRVDEGGPWITVAGDKNKPTAGGKLPCKTEGCFAGQLILRFVGRDGIEEIIPVGASLVWTATKDGTIYYGINDDTFYDNKWYESGGIQDHASVSIVPAK